MSWQAQDAIDRLPYDATGPLAFRVLQKLANVAAQDGSRAWRSIPEVANELGVSVRSVQRALKELEDGAVNAATGEQIPLIRRGDQRHVDHMRADRRPTVYDVNMRAADLLEQLHASLDDEPAPAAAATEIEVQTTAERGTSDGVTELSTPERETPYGVTHDATTVVVSEGTNRTPRERYSGTHSTRARPGAQRGRCGHAVVSRSAGGARYCSHGCRPEEVA